jgi:hypothetical protein
LCRNQPIIHEYPLQKPFPGEGRGLGKKCFRELFGRRSRRKRDEAMTGRVITAPRGRTFSDTSLTPLIRFQSAVPAAIT